MVLPGDRRSGNQGPCHVLLKAVLACMGFMLLVVSCSEGFLVLGPMTVSVPLTG